MKNRTVIKIWKGRAYLHQEWESFGFPCERDTPLGNNTEYIKDVQHFYNCKIIFLNDDFTVKDKHLEKQMRI